MQLCVVVKSVQSIFSKRFNHVENVNQVHYQEINKKFSMLTFT